MSGPVAALAISGNTTFAAGQFTAAAGVAANYVAKWNGAWTALGSGTGGTDGLRTPSVYAVAAARGNLYVGGDFTTVGGKPIKYLAKWDGNDWSSLGSGIGAGVGPYFPGVRALTILGSDLYVGGNFTNVGGESANFVAKWNGAWSSLDSGLSGPVLTFAVLGNDIYAGGDFNLTVAGAGRQVNNVAKWDGTAWNALGSGMNGSVQALAPSGNILFAGGHFTTAGGSAANRIAKWDGNSWSSLGAGMNNWVEALAVSGTNLFAGGFFTVAGANAVNYIAKWNGNVWSPLSSGIGGEVRALAISGGNLYAGGRFSAAGGSSANCVAKWDGSVWSSLGSGMGGRDGIFKPDVYALTASGGELFVGGNFTTAGGKVSAYVAKGIIDIPPLSIVATNASLGVSDGHFYFTMTGPAGSNVVISASTNLTVWTPVLTNKATGG